MRKLFCLFGLLVLSASSYAVQGWMWFNNFPWVYSHEDENWIYVATAIEVSSYDSGKWSKQDDSYLSNLGWVWMNRFPWCYSHKEKKWIYITRPSSSVKDVVVIELKDGPVVIETFRDAAPNHVERIEKLASTGQYDGVVFHRVIEGFMAQTGDVQYGKIDNFQDSLVGTGRSELPYLNSEFNDIKHVRGTCSMARANDPHSANSQFFICFEPAPFLDNQYTVWGQVIEGMEHVDQIKLGDEDDIDLGKVTDPDHMLKVNVEKYSPIHVYGAWNNEWSDFDNYKHDWDKQYAKWLLSPEAYGGLDTLQQIKGVKENGLEGFQLWEIEISDLSPLLSLKTLTILLVTGGDISDVSPLRGLLKLSILYLDRNYIQDLSPLSELTNLTTLSLTENNIANLSPLSELTNLTTLSLTENNIANLSPLSELTNLYVLYLERNNITNLSPIIGLSALRELNLNSNTISDISAIGELTNLSRLWLGNNNISDLTPVVRLTNLGELSLVNNNISDLTPLAGLTNLQYLNLSGNPITISQKAMLEEALQNTNILWPGVFIDDSQETDDSQDTEPTWEEKYEEWIKKPEPYGREDVLQQIKQAMESGATELDLAVNLISDISPLAWLNNLKELDLSGNWFISDLTPLAGMTNLTRLTLWLNNISDLTPLAGLTNLVVLDLSDNNISDLTPLSGLTNLMDLDLTSSGVSDLTPLAGMTNLRVLDFTGNDVSDLTPLAGMTNLRALWFGTNNISDLTPLAGLTKLTELTLWNNNISDISPLQGLTNLTYLALSSNNISDISPLEGLTNLTELELRGNNISDLQKAMLEVALPNTNIRWDWD